MQHCAIFLWYLSILIRQLQACDNQQDLVYTNNVTEARVVLSTCEKALVSGVETTTLFDDARLRQQVFETCVVRM